MIGRRSQVTVAAEHGIGQDVVGLHPLPQRSHGGAAQINRGPDLTRKDGSGRRAGISFQEGPTVKS